MRSLIGIAVALSVASAPLAAHAESTIDLLATDANLVTALDVSDSIMRHEQWIEFEGIARAVIHPSFLRAIAAGYHGRIGFAVFTWSGTGRRTIIVPWTIIDSDKSAQRVAGQLQNLPSVDRWRHDDEATGTLLEATRWTDVSAAIDFGARMLDQAPYVGNRDVLNICGNGVDNVDEESGQARQAALATGITINGVVLGTKPSITDYFRDHVAGGSGSFVLEAKEAASFADAMVTKFLRDLIAAGPQPASAG